MGTRLTDQQRAVVEAPVSVAVTAGAGTGKTELLAERFIAHLSRAGCRPLEIVAVTFTERAAAELRERIRRNLTRDFSDRADWLAEVEAAPIGTLHGLCARIAREHPRQAGVAPVFGVMDDLDGRGWLAERLDDILSRTPTEWYGDGDRLTFTQARAALWPLINNPILADEALLVATTRDGPAQWREQTRLRLREVAEDPAWVAAVARLDAVSGPDGLDDARRTALGLVGRLQSEPARAARELAEVKYKRAGQKANWQDITEVRDALGVLVEGATRLAGGPLYDDVVDGRHARRLARLRELFEFARAELAEQKRLAGLLDFADLEVAALRALDDATVRAYYGQRWRAFIVDECQDVNPVQGRLLRRLVDCSADALVTLVGDEKQSIYGFRGARPEVFGELRADLVAARSGQAKHDLSRSFRSHAPLVKVFNTLFAPVVEGYRDQTAERAQAPHDGPCLELAVVEPDDSKPNTARLRRAEADYLARRVAGWLDPADPLLVAGRDGTPRPARPGDMAILTRAWAPLELYGDALAAAGIPVVHAGGGDLLATREAKDAAALLRFLAAPHDNLALAAVLRSPFFACDDHTVLALARAARDSTWWAAMPGLGAAWQRPREVLGELLEAVPREAPSRLLSRADALTGYSAVIANLPPGERRLADWRGFVAWIRDAEQGSGEVFGVVRRLRQAANLAIEVPRPALAPGDAVLLITYHGAKGLEWPVVIAPDLGRGTPNDAGDLLFDAQLGVSLRQHADDGAVERTWLSGVLDAEQKRRAAQENQRLAYVALTRARDHLLLTTAARGDAGSLWATLEPGLATGVACTEDREACAYQPERAVPRLPQMPPAPPAPTAEHLLLEATPIQPGELPVTALGEYHTCPHRFRRHYLDGFPTELDRTPDEDDADATADASSANLGTLTHEALETGADTPDALRSPGTAAERDEAVALARRFRTEAVFDRVRADDDACEVRIRLQVGTLTLVGRVDRVGADYVVDYKTGRHATVEEHGLQLWAYSEALDKRTAYLADLRQVVLHELGPDRLAEFGDQARRVAEAIAAGRFEPSSGGHCQHCPFQPGCPAKP